MSLLIILLLLPTIHLSWQEQTNTVEPRYNKGKGLAKFVCYIYITGVKKGVCFTEDFEVWYIEVPLYNAEYHHILLTTTRKSFHTVSLFVKGMNSG